MCLSFDTPPFYFYKNAFAGFSFLSELIIPPSLLKFNSVYAKN